MANLASRSTHAARLERFLGADQVAKIAASMRDWYGPPIPVAHCYSPVFATAGGDFHGVLAAGKFGSLLDYHLERMRKAYARWVRRGHATLPAGFASFSDLIAEYSASGKRNVWNVQKVGTTGVVGATNSLWRVGNQPAAASAPSNAPGGTVPTDATTGALAFTNPSGGDTQHFLQANVLATVSAQTLLLYDRIFEVNKTMNSTATEAVTGVPSRYQSTTATDPGYIGGNFIFVECQTALPATAHNWTTCTYTDQGGNASTLPSLTGNSSNIINRLDHPTGQWFAPLGSGDVGIGALTQMQCSAAVATGAIAFVIGHPIAWIPCPLANFVVPTDGLRGPLTLARVFDDAALALLEVMKSATTATTYAGTLETVYG